MRFRSQASLTYCRLALRRVQLLFRASGVLGTRLLLPLFVRRCCMCEKRVSKAWQPCAVGLTGT
jgi:hypothetical protein